MRKVITITLSILSALLILDSFQAPQAVMMFFLAGQIPGTTTAVSASTMLEIYLLLAGFIGARLTIAATKNVRVAILNRRAA